ncbi:MAG: VCBS repeat-containing protein [Bacteroidetes bacterium]|nr:VCBS repeat-containing protein [Bacteroidota bacterium]
MNKYYLSLAFLVLIGTKILAQTSNWSWQATIGPYGSTVNDLAINSGNVFFAATNGGLFSSADGTNWNRLSVIANNNFPQSFIDVEVSSTGMIYAMQASYSPPSLLGLYSSADGISWASLAGTGLPYSLKKIKVAPNGTIYILPSFSNQLYRSTNNGVSFSAIPKTFSSNITDIAVDGNNRLIVGTATNSVQVSADNGISFNAIGSGISSTLSCSSITVDGSNNLYVLGSDAPYRSTNNGGSWSSIKGSISEVYFGGIITTDLLGNLYLVNQNSTKIYSCTNPAGASPTWSPGTNYSSSNANFLNCAFFKNLTSWYIGRTGTGVDKSIDGGNTWNVNSNGLRGYIPGQSKLFISSSGRLFQSFGNWGYNLSIDGGITWNLLFPSGTANVQLTGFVKLADGSILGYGYNGVVRSANDGNTWTLQSSTSVNNLYTGDGNKLYYFVGNTINLSTNQGVSWAPQSITGLPPGNISSLVIDTAGNIYLSYYNNATSTTELWKINSGTTTANKVSTYPGSMVITLNVTASNSIFLTDNVATKLYKSTNGGSTWATITLPAGQGNVRSIYFYDDNNIIAQFSTGGVQGSLDGGASWQNRPLTDPAPAQLSDVKFAPDQTAYATTAYSVVQKSSTPIIPPVAPTGLVLLSKSIQSIDLKMNYPEINTAQDIYVQWSVGNNTSYNTANQTRLGYAPSSPQNLVVVYNTSADSTVTYYYRAYAINAAGNSAYSNEISGTALAGNRSSTIPDNRSWTAVVTADPGSTASGAGPFTSTTVSIVKIPNTINQFTISRYDLGVVPPAIHPSLGAANITETQGQTYFQGDPNGNDDANGNGTWNSVSKTLVLKWQPDPNYYTLFQGTTTLTLNTTDPIPGSAAINAYAFSSSQSVLLWTTVPFATQYIIERSTTSNTFSGPPLATINYPTTQYIDAGLSSGTTYYYRITAKNSAGSAAASTQSAVTLPISTLFSPVLNNFATNTDYQQGVSWADLDGDGDEDYISPAFSNQASQNSVPSFYENVGSGQFNRRSIAVLQNENIATYRGAYVADVNNDGKLDVYLARSSSGAYADLLLINEGSWSFTKQFIPGTATSNAFRGTAMADYNKDGLVDMAISQQTQAQSPLPPTLLANASAGSTITFNVVNNAGTITTNTVMGIMSSWADFNNDGWQDLLVLSKNGSPPTIPNRLYKNNGDGTFTQVTGTIFDSDIFVNSRTASWGDINNDGYLDVYIGSQTVSVADRLYKNNGNGTFTSLSGSAVAETGTQTYGSAFGDINNDGSLDLIAINGNGNSIFINDGAGNFTKTPAGQELFTLSVVSNIGGSFVDYDQNGFLDISTGRTAGSVTVPPYLFRNTLVASSSRNWVEVKLKGIISNTAAIGARIIVTTLSPARTQIREISSCTGYGSMSSLIQHFGLGSASAISSIQVKWPNGGVQTLTNPGINQIITIPEILTGPTFTNLSPANGASGITTNTTLSFTTNTPVLTTAVAGKNINVYLSSNTSTPVFSMAATSGSVSGNTYTYTLPVALNPLVSYSVSIDAGAFIDVYGNPSLALPLASWQFTTIDNIPPAITFTPVPTLTKAGLSSSSFSLTATDNISVTSVVMSYRKITATQYQTLNGTAGASNTYSFPLQSSMFDDMGIEYYFTAKDPSNNTATSPATGTYTTRLIFDGTAAAVVGVAAGSQKSDYKIISVPLELTSNSIANIFNDFGAADNTKWRLLSYKDNPQAWLQYPGDFSNASRGAGYFVISRVGQNLAFQGATSPNYNQNNLFQLSLSAGYNLIGNPYTTLIDWEDTRSGQTGVGAVKLFQNGNYVDNTSGGSSLIQPYSGGFVFSQNAVTIPVKFKLTTTGTVKNNSSISTRNSTDWIVPIRMTQDNREFNFGGVGMAENASFSYDNHDDLAPPSPLGTFKIEFPHPEHFMKNFSKDVIPPLNGYTWTFFVNSDETSLTTLAWDSQKVNATGDLYLLDVSRQYPVNMLTQHSYSFNPQQSREFKVYYGTDVNDKLKPQTIFLGQAYPNPATKEATIPFNLPESSNPFFVTIEVYDLMGNRVTSLVNTQLNSGFYTSTWNSSEANSGIYVYRMKVEQGNSTQSLSGKIIVIK